jgi:uncharacterized membrane protein
MEKGGVFMTETGTGAEAIFGLLFGLFGIIYMAILLFIVILSIVFIFKVMTFMKNKTENDKRLLQAIESLNNTNSLTKSLDPKSNDS